MGASRRVTSYEDEMRAVFRAFDTNDDGLITAQDIQETMKVCIVGISLFVYMGIP